jgi:hypothetical protein
MLTGTTHETVQSCLTRACPECFDRSGPARARSCPATPAPVGRICTLDQVDVTPKAAPDEARLKSHRNETDSGGRDVDLPAKSKSSQVPVGASAQCRDGTYNFSYRRRGNCSHHGGVAT